MEWWQALIVGLIWAWCIILTKWCKDQDKWLLRIERELRRSDECKGGE